MSTALSLGGLLLGFGASAHCAAMCGAPCAAVTRRGAWDATGFHVGRLVAYMAAGAVAAGSLSALAALREVAPWVRPLWVIAQMLLLALGLWLVFTGRQPDWRWGRAPAPVAAGWAPLHGPLHGPARAAGVGLAWVAWPCGLLYSALALAALASSPAGGAAVMGAFAMGSMPALAVAPVLLRRLSRGRTMGVRMAGGLMVAASAWALGHGVWKQALAWCGFG